MLNRLIGLVLFGIIVGVIVLNYKQILAFAQARELQGAAQKAVQAENWEKAVQVYEDGWHRYPDNADIGNRLAWYYAQNHDAKDAESAYRLVLKREPGNVNAQIGLGNLLKSEPPRVNEAVDIFRAALKKHPDDSVLLSQIGNLYVTAAENSQETREPTRKWLYDQATYYYQQSLKREPDQFQTQFNLGVAYQNLENLEPSAKAYCAALRIQPDSFQARYNLGMVLTELNFLDEGYRQMNRAVSILSGQGDMKAAMQMAQRVQNVKNSVYNNPNRAGLGKPSTPDFLETACLYTAPPEGTESNAQTPSN
jgi:tetratricopeptide (TPR) repeat protein